MAHPKGNRIAPPRRSDDMLQKIHIFTQKQPFGP